MHPYAVCGSRFKCVEILDTSQMTHFTQERIPSSSQAAKKNAIAVTCLSSLKPSQTANSRGAVVCAAYPWIQTMGSILKSRKCSLTSQSLQERRPPKSPIPTLGQLCEL